MVVDDEQPSALAGPSTVPSPPLFLPPPGPPQHPSHLSSTQDILARFHLLPAYDKYVRPFYAAPPSAQDNPPTPSAKGKERERDIATSPAAAQTPGADGFDGDDDDGGAKGEKKKKNSYKHLIKGVPGKHSMKKDTYLTTMMQVPPKQRLPITEFDLKTQREAFSVSLEGLKGWNVNTLVLESAQAREDRKRRKELKKLAKAQALGASPSSAISPGPGATPHPYPPLPVGAPIAAPARTATPKPRPPTITTARVGTPVDTPRPQPTPTSAHPLSQAQQPPIPPPDPGKRGKKRDHEDGMTTPVSSDANAPRAVLGAKAGVAGVRPRPLKKQRMDTQGQARDVPVQQQPTPQGV